jgi:hypothetical protein
MPLLLVAVPLLYPSQASAETTVIGDQDAGAVVIEGFRAGTTSPPALFQPCFDPAAVERVTPALRERVVRYLPEPAPGTSPKAGALVNIPVVAYSGQRAVTLDATVLGERVLIWLTPTFSWKWGDGRALVTSRPGRPYPSRAVTHTYRRACACPIALTTTWSGTWGFEGGETYPLGSVLTQDSRVRLRIREAPIRLTR